MNGTSVHFYIGFALKKKKSTHCNKQDHMRLWLNDSQKKAKNPPPLYIKIKTKTKDHSHLSVQCLYELRRRPLYQTKIAIEQKKQQLSTCLIAKCNRTSSCKTLQCRKTKVKLWVIHHSYGIKGSSNYIQIDQFEHNKLRVSLAPLAMFTRIVK